MTQDYTSLGNMPYVQFGSVSDFIPEPRCSKFAVGLQTEGRKMEGTRGPVRLWSEGPRVMGAPLCAKCLSLCSWLEPSGSACCVLVNLIDLINLSESE